MKFVPILIAATLASLALAKANLVISEIDLVANKVEIVNTGTSSVNMAGYQWCNLWKGSPSYVAVSTGQIVALESTVTTLNLPAGAVVTFLVPGTSAGSFITDLQGEVGLYSSGSFGSSTAMVDYVSWGGDAVRDSVAAGKVPSIWGNGTSVAITAADITAGRSIQLGAGLAGNGFADYSVAAPTIGVNQVTPLPVVTTGSASAVAATTATVSGTVNAKGVSTTVTFQYGETLTYGSSAAATPSPVTGFNATAVSAALSGLIPGTTYHYRVVASSTNGNTEGADQTFTTTAPPVATTGIASGITSNSASLAGTVNANGASTTVIIEYGESITYGSSVAATPSPVTGLSPTAISGQLSGLDPEKLYHFRVVATNAYGTVPGSDGTFTTTATPIITDLPVTAVSHSGNTLTVDFNGPPNTPPASWQVMGSATLASFTDDKTPDSTITEIPAGSGKYQAQIDVTGEPASYFVKIALP